MSHEESKSNNNNNKEEILPYFGGYQGGKLRWNTLKKRGKYARRYKKKDSEMMQRILSTTISN
jgi:hypothetical protein